MTLTSEPQPRDRKPQRSALQPAAHDPREDAPTVHPHREEKGARKSRNQPKKLTPKSLKKSPARQPSKPKSVKHSERTLQVVKDSMATKKRPSKTRDPSNPTSRANSKTKLTARSSSKAKGQLNSQSQSSKKDKQDKNLPIKMQKEGKAKNLMGMPKGRKLNSQLHANASR